MPGPDPIRETASPSDACAASHCASCGLVFYETPRRCSVCGAPYHATCHAYVQAAEALCHEDASPHGDAPGNDDAPVGGDAAEGDDVVAGACAAKAETIALPRAAINAFQGCWALGAAAMIGHGALAAAWKTNPVLTGYLAALSLLCFGLAFLWLGGVLRLERLAGTENLRFFTRLSLGGRKIWVSRGHPYSNTRAIRLFRLRRPSLAGPGVAFFVGIVTETEGWPRPLVELPATDPERPTAQVGSIASRWALTLARASGRPVAGLLELESERWWDGAVAWGARACLALQLTFWIHFLIYGLLR